MSVDLVAIAAEYPRPWKVADYSYTDVWWLDSQILDAHGNVVAWSSSPGNEDTAALIVAAVNAFTCEPTT